MSNNTKSKNNTIMLLSLTLSKLDAEKNLNSTNIINLQTQIEKNNSLIQQLAIAPKLPFVTAKIVKINDDLLKCATDIEDINDKLKINPQVHNNAFTALKQIIFQPGHSVDVEEVDYDYKDVDYDENYHTYTIGIDPKTVTLASLEDEYCIHSKSFNSIICDSLEKLQTSFKQLENEYNLMSSQLSTVIAIINPIMTNEEHNRSIALKQENIKNLMEERELIGKEYKLQEQLRISKETAILIAKNIDYNNELEALNNKSKQIVLKIQEITREIIDTASK